MAARGRAIRAGQGYFELFADDSRLVRGLRNAQKKMKAFGKTISAAGFDAIKGGIASSLPFLLASQQFQTFEAAMARVGALTEAVGQDFEKLTALAQKLGSETIFTATDAANAMGKFAVAGYDLNTIMKATGPTLALAAAGEMEIAEAASIVTKLLNNMQIPVDQLAPSIDVMAKAFTTANTDLFELGEAFKFVGPIAQDAGIAFEEITAAIQILSDAGIQGEMAGTTLRGVILSLTSPSEMARDELSRLGVSVTDANDDVRSLTAIMADFERAMAGFGSGRRLDVLGKIFDARQASGAAKIISEGASELSRRTQELAGSAGTANRIANALLDTQQGDFKILTSALENLAIEVGKTYTGALREAFRNVTNFLNLATSWVEQNEKLVTSLGIASVGLIGFGSTLVAVGLGMKVFALGLTAIVPVAGLLGAVVSALASPIGVLAAAVTGIILVFVDWQTVMNGVVDYIYRVFGKVAPYINDTIQAMSLAISQGKFPEATRLLLAGMNAVLTAGTRDILLVWQGLQLAMQLTWIDAWAAIESTVFDIGNSIVQHFSVIELAWRVTMARMRGETLSLFELMQEAKKTSDEILETGRVSSKAQEQIKADAEKATTDAFAKFAIDQANAHKDLEEARKAFEAAREAIVNPQAPDIPAADVKAKIRSVDIDGLERGAVSDPQGGFNVQALARSFGGNAIERTAKATEKTQKDTAELVRIFAAAQFGLLIR